MSKILTASLFLVASLAQQSVAQCSVTYAAGATLANFGGNPPQVAIGDFDHDGNADIVMASTTGTVIVYYGSGSNTFVSQTQTAFAGGQYVGLAVADFNGDGYSDIALIPFNTATVAIGLGNSTHTLTRAANISVGAGVVTALAAGDFTRDGKADVAAIVGSSGTIVVNSSHGDGTFSVFQTATGLAGVANAAQAMPAILNANGNLDLAIMSNAHLVTRIVWTPGTGFTSSMPPVPFSSTFSFAAAAGDINRDGYPDVVVSHFSPAGFSAFMFNPSTQNFDAPIDYGFGSQNHGIVLTDLNNDGALDVVIAQETSDLVCALNLGNGTYNGGPRLTISANPYFYVAAADFNEDGRVDLVASIYNSVSRTYVETASVGPALLVSPHDTAATVGGSVSFPTTIGGGSLTPTYLWKLNGSPISNGGRFTGATTGTLTINPVQASDIGANVTVTVTNSCGSVTSQPALITGTVCLADFNNDSMVDFFDYLDFVDAFSSNLPEADFNHDSTIDFFDYLDFVDAFSIGC